VCIDRRGSFGYRKARSVDRRYAFSSLSYIVQQGAQYTTASTSPIAVLRDVVHVRQSTQLSAHISPIHNTLHEWETLRKTSNATTPNNKSEIRRKRIAGKCTS
jgi:hypothetical protein